MPDEGTDTERNSSLPLQRSLEDAELRSAHGVALSVQTPHAGIELRAAESFRKGETLWDEVPLAAMQHRHSRRCVATCAHCLRPIGQLRSSVDRLLALEGKSLEKDYPEVFAMNALDDPKMPWNSRAGAQAVACPSRCGSEFCSTNCAAEASAGGHGILCRVLRHERAAWDAFEEHAASSNESFVLAAQVLLEVLASVGRGEPAVTALAHFLRFDNEKFPWPELVEESQELRGRSAAQQRWREKRIEAMETSRNLLCKALTQELQRLSEVSKVGAEGLEELLLGTQTYSLLCGQLDLTNIFVEFAHPSSELLSQAPLGSSEVVRRVLQISSPLGSALSQVAARIQEEEEGLAAQLWPSQPQPSWSTWEALAACTRAGTEHDMSLPAVQGLGFFATISLMNHSCEPSCKLVYQRGCRVGSIVALRDIQKGEELSITYLDLDGKEWSLHERQQKLLEDYRFVCCCSLCLREAESAAAKKIKASRKGRRDERNELAAERVLSSRPFKRLRADA